MELVCAKCSARKPDKVFHSVEFFSPDVLAPRGYRASCVKWDSAYIRAGRKSDFASNLADEVRADRFDKARAALFLKTAFWYDLKF